MADFPVALTNAVDGVPGVGTEILAKHLNNLEAKVGIDASAVTTSLDYLLKNPASISPGHKHSNLWTPNGSTSRLISDAYGVKILNDITGIGIYSSIGYAPYLPFLVQVNPYTGLGLLFAAMGDNNLGPALLLAKSRSTDGNTPAIVQNGDQLFQIAAIADDGSGTQLVTAAYIEVDVDGVPGVNSVPGKITFNTATGGVIHERVVINNLGQVGVNFSTPTISDGIGLHIGGKILRIGGSKTPATAGATGNQGEICWDSGFIYVAVNTNTWKRAAIATW